MGENIDWETKDCRDQVRDFVAAQIRQHGDFDTAVKAYCEKTGTPMPTFVVDDVVLDYTMKRVGVPLEGPEEPNFLGTVRLGQRRSQSLPQTESDQCPRLPGFTCKGGKELQILLVRTQFEAPLAVHDDNRRT